MANVLVASDVSAYLVRVFAFVFGALWGSFFNVAIYRWPRGMSVISPPSHCPACGAPVRWYLNVPIIGYVLLRGRARCCGAPMTPRYVWVELLSAVLFLAVAERFFVDVPERDFQAALIETALYWAFVGGLVVATFVDFEWMEIPDEVSLAGAALGLATVGFRQVPDATSAAVGAGLGYLCVQVPFVWLYEQLRGVRGMGEGDSKLLMMIGAFLGWQGVLFCLLAGSIQGLVVAGIGMATGMPLVPRRPDEDEPSEMDPSANDPSRDATERGPRTDGDSSSDDDHARTSQVRIASASKAPGAAESDVEADASEAVSAGPRSAAPAGRANEAPGAASHPAGDDEESGPPMMVFGPMLALSALEYLFFSERLASLWSSFQASIWS